MAEKDKRSKEDKKGKRSRLMVSRRSFLKGMGASAIATARTSIPAPSLPEAAAALPAGLREAVIELNVNERIYRLKVKSHWTSKATRKNRIGPT